MADQNDVIRFIHIAHAGGQFVKDVLRKAGQTDRDGPDFWVDKRILIPAQISVAKMDKRRGTRDRLAFTFRDPIDRFVGGFYNRQCMGLPDHPSVWDTAEAVVFSQFDSPNELAETLYDDHYPTRARAEFAMQAIQDIRKGYEFHFGPQTEFMFGLLPRMAACLDIRDMGHKGPAFFEKIGITMDHPANLDQQFGDGAHVEKLSDKANENLSKFLKAEIEYYGMFREIQAALFD